MLSMANYIFLQRLSSLGLNIFCEMEYPLVLGLNSIFKNENPLGLGLCQIYLTNGFRSNGSNLHKKF